MEADNTGWQMKKISASSSWNKYRLGFIYWVKQEGYFHHEHMQEIFENVKENSE